MTAVVIIAVIVTMIESSTRPDMIAAAPATVVIAVGFVVVADISDANISLDTDARHGARIQTGERQGGDCHGQQRAAKIAHLVGSALVSLSLHSIRPSRAPAGSVTTATMPPWRSGCGCTSILPPNSTAFAARSAAS